MMMIIIIVNITPQHISVKKRMKGELFATRTCVQGVQKVIIKVFNIYNLGFKLIKQLISFICITVDRRVLFIQINWLSNYINTCINQHIQGPLLNYFNSSVRGNQFYNDQCKPGICSRTELICSYHGFNVIIHLKLMVLFDN